MSENIKSNRTPEERFDAVPNNLWKTQIKTMMMQECWTLEEAMNWFEILIIKTVNDIESK